MSLYDKMAGVFSTASDEVIEDFIEIYEEYKETFGIHSLAQENFFLAEIREEVGPTLESRRENLNYSCKALKKIFRYYRNHPSEAARDGRCNHHRANQRKIANKVYAYRIGNGSYKSGEGYRFRGGGFFQITGKNNYEMIARVITERTGIDVTPYDVETEISSTQMGVLSALAFWYNKKMYNCSNIDCVTRRINRYTDSYKKRKKHYLKLAEYR